MMPLERKLNLAFSGTALALLAWALWQAYSPYVGRMQDVGAIRGSITPITVSGLAAKLKKEPYPPTVLYIYASWCSKCGLVTPHLAGIIREHEYDDVRFLFVSVDSKSSNLMDYLVRTHYDGLFVPYRLQPSPGESLPQMMASLGGHYPGAIPYLAFLGRHGRLVKDLSGVASREEILGALERIRE